MKNIMTARVLFAAVFAAAAFRAFAGSIPMATVPVGNAGNAADINTGGLYGAVGYNYNIGTYDVTLTQYTAFLNSVAATDTYGLYDPSLATDLNVAGISRSGGPGSYHYVVIGDGQRPVTYVSWYDAVRFVNWLETGNTESGAYTITGGSNNGGTMPTTAERAAWARDSVTHWYLPDENEWYKAAFYDPTKAGSNKYWHYPTRNDNPPSNVLSGSGTNNANYLTDGNVYTVTHSTSYSSSQNYLTDVGAFGSSPGPFGTFDQGGDVLQWNDWNPDIASSQREMRGSSWDYYANDMASSYRFGSDLAREENDYGFRVASSVAVPEPGSLALALVGAAAVVAWRKRWNE